AAAAVWRVAHPDAPLAPPIARFDVLLPGGATLDGSAPAIAFSPSGARLAAAACDAAGRCQLLVPALDRLEMHPPAATGGAPALPPRTRTVALSLDTGQRTIVVDRGASPRFVAPNTITFVRDGDLMAAAFDPSQLKIVGQPVVVAPRVGDAPSEYAVSRAGALATAVGQDEAPAFALAWAARNEAVEPLPRALQNLAAPQPSLDGRRIAAVKSADEPAELWWADVERGTLSRVTFDGEHRDPRWAPGGDAIVFASRAGGVFNLFTRGLDDRSAPRRLTTSPHHQAPGGVSRDGLIVFVDFDPASGADLWSVPLAGGAPQPILRTPFDEEAPAIAAARPC